VSLSTITPSTPPPPLQVNAAVASHFLPPEMRAASAWQARHPEIPAMGNFLKVFPDPVINKIHVELNRINDRRSGRVPKDADVVEREPFADPDEQTAEERAELEEPEDDDGEGSSRDDYDVLIDSAADGIDLSGEIWDRLKAAEYQPRRDRSPDRFMAALDGFIEPYLAVKRGMSLGEAARTFNVAHIQQRLERVEMWLSLCEQLPRFNRGTFLNRLERAVEKRRRDARIGAERGCGTGGLHQTARGREYGEAWGGMGHDQSHPPSGWQSKEARTQEGSTLVRCASQTISPRRVDCCRRRSPGDGRAKAPADHCDQAVT
jgi:hypothetical protein